MGMLGGKDSQWNARTAGLLHTRLKAVGLVMVIGMTVGLGRDLFLDLGFSMVFPWIIWATMVTPVAYLWWEKEAPLIKEHLGAAFTVVTPGIRLPEGTRDDQARVVTPRQAVASGADYIVVGRPIIAAPDPVLACQKVLENMTR